MSDSVRAIALIGNRYSRMSEAFFEALLPLIEQRGLTLVLIDSSTAAQARWTRVLRNRLVAALKALAMIRTATHSRDWFRRKDARRFLQLTPTAHRIASPSLADEVEQRGVGAILVAGCDQILRRPLIDRVRRIINFHNGSLPAYRGCDVVLWSLLNRDRVAGYSFHTIESEEIDRGVIVASGEIPLTSDDNVGSIDEKLIRAAVADLPCVVDNLCASVWPPAGMTLGHGSYYTASQSAAIRTFDVSMSKERLLTVFRAARSLRIPGPFALRVTGLVEADEAGGHAWTLSLLRGRVVVRCRDGYVAITTVNYLPAVFFLPVLIWCIRGVSDRPRHA